MDSDGAQYDAEGRQPGILDPTTEALTGYVYDAEGRRVEKVLVNGWNTPNPQSVIQDEYLLGLNDEQVTVLNGSDFRPALRCRVPDPLFC